MTDDLLFAGVERLAAATTSGDVSSRELTEACLARVEELNGRLNAFTKVMRDKGLAEADARDRSRADGRQLGPLHGVPVAIKEELDVAGEVTTFGGRANTSPAVRDAESVRRLREAGAVIIGSGTPRGRRVGPVAAPPPRLLPGWCRSAWAVTAAAPSGSRPPAAASSGSSHSGAGSAATRTTTSGGHSVRRAR
jgi:amidase